VSSDGNQAAQRALLLTGATGFVGMEVLARWLERTERPIVLLVRAADDEEARGRLRSIMATLYDHEDAYAGRVSPVAADIQQPALGLEWDRLVALSQQVGQIVHCAASVSFTLGLEESRSINVLGTRRMLELAELCRRQGHLERFSYVSTAYVAGTHPGVFREDQLDVGQNFRNPYERSKFEAERSVHAQRERLPIQVLRPSIVVGDRSSGWTSSFNVLYTPLKAFARGTYPAAPARRSSPVDIVPIDYVADAIFELSSGGGEGTYHLVSGRQATTVGRLIELASRRFGRRPPWIFPSRIYRKVVHPLLLRRARGRRRVALERTEVFFPYFSMRVRYDNRRARERLEPVGVRVTPVESYFHRLVDFAERARWGRREVPRRAAKRDEPAPEPTGSRSNVSLQPAEQK
jgi:thioester reductase-like protein